MFDTKDKHLATGSFASVFAGMGSVLVIMLLGTLLAMAQTMSQVEPAAEQVFKNIQVLKGIPSSQVRTMMSLIDVSLGVRCDTCHVSGQFEKDEKEGKKTARKMIQMVLDTNNASFDGQTEVSCYTCHRGQILPLTVPTIGQSSAPTTPVAPVAAKAGEGLPSFEQILQRYKAAIGEPASFGKLKTRVMKGTLTDARGESNPVEVVQSVPDKIATLITTPKGIMGSGYNGKTGWNKTQRGLNPLAGIELVLMQRTADFARALRIDEEAVNPRVTGKAVVGNREAYVVNARADEQRIQLLFDVETGLLLRRKVMIGTPIGALPQQTDFEDYREVDGIRLPFVTKFSGPDPNSATTTVYREIAHNIAIEEAKFSPPEK